MLNTYRHSETTYLTLIQLPIASQYHPPFSTGPAQELAGKIWPGELWGIVRLVSIRATSPKKLRKEWPNTCNTTPAKCRHVIHFARLITCLWTCKFSLDATSNWSCFVLLVLQALQALPQRVLSLSTIQNVYPDLNPSPKHNRNSNSDEPTQTKPFRKQPLLWLKLNL